MKVRRRREHRKYTLERLVKENDWTYGAELGVLKGDTFLHLLRTCPHLRLIGVDTWAPDYSQEDRRAEGGRTYADHPLEGYYKAIRAALAAEGLADRAMLKRTTTQSAARSIKNSSLDFVFIDADHTYEGVAADIDGWQRKVRPGGMILGHDYNPRDFPGVVQAVNERFASVLLFPDHVWAVEC